MWSAKQVLPESSNARNEALELSTLLGLEFTPAVTNRDNSNVRLDPDLLYDITDALAGLIVIYKYLIKSGVLTDKQVLAILITIKDRLIPAIEELFKRLRTKQDVTDFRLIMAVSDRRFITIWPQPTTQISLIDWNFISRPIPAPIEGVSYNLALLLESFWEKNNQVWE